MKKLVLLLMLTSLFVVSCTTETELTDQTNETKMLESYVVKRNTDGSYTLTYQVAEGVGSTYYENVKENGVELFFNGSKTVSTESRNYNINNNELKINFVTENNSFSPKIKITDDNTGTKGAYGLLNDYSVSEVDENTIVINYQVESGVRVELSYDEVEQINNIKLVPDAGATKTDFSTTFQKESDGSLKVDFLQPAENKADETDDTDYKKPRLIIEV